MRRKILLRAVFPAILMLTVGTGAGCRSCDKHGQSAAGSSSETAELPPGPEPGHESPGVLARAEGSVASIEPTSEGVRLTVLTKRRQEVTVVSAPRLGWKPGDHVFVRGPWKAIGESAAVDCSRAEDCSLGLASGGDVRIRGLDYHHCARLFAQLFRADVIAVGGGAEPLFFDARADEPEATAKAFAAAAGVSTRTLGELRLFGPGSALPSSEAEAMPTRCYPTSLDEYLVDGDEIAVQLSERLRCRPRVSAELSGAATMVLRRAETPRLLSLLLGLSGAQWRAGDTEITLLGPAALPDVHGLSNVLQEARERQPWKEKIARHRIDELVLAATVVRQGQPGKAVFQVRVDGRYGWAAVLETGDFLTTADRAETADGAAASTQWRVKTIERDRVILSRETGIVADRTVGLASRNESPSWWLARPPKAPEAMLTVGTCPSEMASVGGICIDRAEATVRQYEACVKAGACTEASSGGLCNAARPGRGEHPVNCLTWDQARAYCAWAGKRVPSADEWARVLVKGSAWGQGEPGSDLVCWRRGRVGTCPALDTRPEAYGLRGLSGNVSEWVDGTGDAKLTHGYRGGSYASEKVGELTEAGNGAEPLPTVGVRCARAP